MCGILGVAACSAIEDSDWLNVGLNTMAHRGPDSDGVWRSSCSRVVLGHKRLSIMDLTTSGAQPMYSKKLGLVVVLNGEIYNFLDLRKILKGMGYSFSSNSDTEVLLAGYDAWGRQLLDKLVGMFSMVIFDIKKQQLFIARDRAGEKPLFYSFSNGMLQFASELKALLANTKNRRYAQTSSIFKLFSFGYVPFDDCIIEGYKKLPPGHFIDFDLVSGKLEILRYWDVPFYNAVEIISDERILVAEMERLLEQSVKRQLVADVPVGVLLSGGLDSSLITAMAARAHPTVKTFTVGFPGFPSFDERTHARLISEYFSTEHTELSASDFSEDLLYRLASQFDEPILDSSMIPMFLVSEMVRSSCKVALSGDGSDELFGGYHHHSRLLWINLFMSWIPLFIRKACGNLSRGTLPTGKLGKSWIDILDIDFRNYFPVLPIYFDDGMQRTMFKDKSIIEPSFDTKAISKVFQNGDILDSILRFDFKNFLSGDILVKADRASMLASLELRSPFLDVDVVEFAFSHVPSRLKADHKRRKILLCMLGEKVLPEIFDYRRKQGFSIPIRAWFQTEKMIKFTDDVLLDPSCVFDPKFVQRIVAGFRRGDNLGEQLFGMIMFELWRNAYNVKI